MFIVIVAIACGHLRRQVLSLRDQSTDTTAQVIKNGMLEAEGTNSMDIQAQSQDIIRIQNVAGNDVDHAAGRGGRSISDRDIISTQMVTAHDSNLTLGTNTTCRQCRRRRSNLVPQSATRKTTNTTNTTNTTHSKNTTKHHRHHKHHTLQEHHNTPQ